MKDPFIPKSTDELYQKLVSGVWKGKLIYNNDCIIWKVYSWIIYKIYINIIKRKDDSFWTEGYIEIYFVDDNGKEEYITHYHPAADEIYDELCKVNDGTYIFIRKKNIFFGELREIISKDEYNPQKYKNTRFTQYDICFI